MRINDIARENTPVNMRTEGLYLPDRRNTPLSARPDYELALGLCYKSGGKIEVCAECPGKCAFGRLLLKRREGGSPTSAASLTGGAYPAPGLVPGDGRKRREETSCATRTKTGS